MLLCCFHSGPRDLEGGLKESRIMGTSAAIKTPKSTGLIGDNLHGKEQVVEHESHWLVVFDLPIFINIVIDVCSSLKLKASKVPDLHLG